MFGMCYRTTSCYSDVLCSSWRSHSYIFHQSNYIYVKQRRCQERVTHTNTSHPPRRLGKQKNKNDNRMARVGNVWVAKELGNAMQKIDLLNRYLRVRSFTIHNIKFLRLSLYAYQERSHALKLISLYSLNTNLGCDGIRYEHC